MTAFFATARDLAVGLTWLWAFIALLAIACLVVAVVTRWLERRRRQPSEPTREQAAWELHVAEAIRITRGDLDTRINTIRNQIAANHDAEVARFRTELNEWGKGA